MSSDQAAKKSLADLGFSTEELAALRRQGFVAREQRAGARVIYKLRFRCDGRQRVRSLGSNPQTAEIIRAQLERWQSATRRNRNMARMTRDMNQVVRDAQRALQSQLEAAGLYFHGQELRRRRNAPPGSTAKKSGT